jgi:hypothetical protein
VLAVIGKNESTITLSGLPRWHRLLGIGAALLFIYGGPSDRPLKRDRSVCKMHL